MTALPLPTIPAFAGLQLETLTTTAVGITISASVAAGTAACPDCHHMATQIHSTYQRHPRDLPWSGIPVQFTLRVRRFFCATATCPRITFVEQVAGFLRASAQRSEALNAALRTLGLALGGTAGARVGTKLGISGSADTILRRVRAMVPETAPAPRVVGIDEWAIRKGRRYGSIIVDLERRCPIAILPEYTPAAITQWFTDHPTIEVIARDRASIYTEALAKGAPHATQVADRWHLTQNLGAALQSFLTRHTGALRTVARQLTVDQTAALPEARPVPELLPLGHIVGPVEQRQYQFAEVKRLRAAGWSDVRIAGELHLNRRTVQKYAHAEAIPRRILPQATSHVTPYLPYLRECWIAGTRHGLLLLKEVQERGYRGSLSSLYRALRGFRVGNESQAADTDAVRVLVRSPRAAMWLLIRVDADRTAEDIAYRNALVAHAPEIGLAAELGLRFLRLVRGRQEDALDSWLTDVEGSGITELQRFAKSLRGDYAPVKAALSSPWSNGQTEGSVNRLKMIKRTMYGRASFEVLRNRVLHSTT